jgi:hypothetical protein
MDQSFQGKTQADKPFAEQLVHAIESVHGVQGIILVPIERKPLADGWNGQFDPYTRTVTVSPNAPLPLTAGVHEIGHALDALFLVSASKLGRLDGPISLYASQYAVNGRGRLVDWYQAIRQTSAVNELQQIRTSFPFMSAEWHEITYVLDIRELWARSYEQFIGTNTGDADVKAQFLETLQRESEVGGRRFRVYWMQEEFQSIEREIKRLLEFLGWM